MKVLLLLAVVLSSVLLGPLVRVPINSPPERDQPIRRPPSDSYPLYVHTLNSKSEWERQRFDREPERVIAVWHSSVETMLALGVGESMVAGIGIADRQYVLPDYREDYDGIPYTNLNMLDLETAMMMEPDFILGWHSTFLASGLRGTDFWQGRGVNTYIARSSAPTSTGHTLYGEYRYIWDAGRIFDRRGRALEIIREMREEIDWVRDRTKDHTVRPTVIVMEIMGKVLRVYGSKTLAGNIVKTLDGNLLAADLTSLSLEQLIEYDPNCLFLVITRANYGNEQFFTDQIYNHKALQGLRCVRERRIYPVPLYSVYSAGIRSYEGIQVIARGLYPELYET